MALHHFVPRFYLKNFSIRSRPEFVWVYRRDNQDPKDINVGRIAAVQDYYKVTLVESGEKSEQVERMFAHLEGVTKPIVDRLISENTHVELSDEEYGTLSIYMAFQFMRGPVFRARMFNSEISKVEEGLKQITKDMETFKTESERMGWTYKDDTEFEETRRILSNMNEHFVIKKKRGEEGAIISSMVEWGEELSQLIFYKKWYLYESRGNGVFVTSDNPLTVMQRLRIPHAKVQGFITGVVALPISPSRCLVLEPGRIRRRIDLVEANRNLVHQLNESTMHNAHKEIYSNLNSGPIKRKFNKTKAGQTEKMLTQQEIEQLEKERLRLLQGKR